MNPNDAQRHEVEFDFNALTRSDLKTRFDSYRVGIYGGFMTPNEARRLEGMPDEDGGDDLIVQGANVRLTSLSEMPNENIN